MSFSLDTDTGERYGLRKTRKKKVQEKQKFCQEKQRSNKDPRKAMINEKKDRGKWRWEEKWGWDLSVRKMNPSSRTHWISLFSSSRVKRDLDWISSFLQRKFYVWSSLVFGISFKQNKTPEEFLVLIKIPQYHLFVPVLLLWQNLNCGTIFSFSNDAWKCLMLM